MGKRRALADWINPKYLDKGVVMEMRAVFAKKGVLLLQDFLRKDALNRARRELLRKSFQRIYLPDRCSFAFLKKPNAHIITLLRSSAMKGYLALIAGKRPAGRWANVWAFGRGDYTILRDAPVQETVSFSLCISSWDSRWGGLHVRRDAAGNALIVAPELNTLLIARTTKRLRWFSQYINHHAGRRRLVLASTF